MFFLKLGINKKSLNFSDFFICALAVVDSFYFQMLQHALFTHPLFYQIEFPYSEFR